MDGVYGVYNAGIPLISVAIEFNLFELHVHYIFLHLPLSLWITLAQFTNVTVISNSLIGTTCVIYVITGTLY